MHLLDVKVLNSTAVKLKLSTKDPEDVYAIEISQNNHIWSQRKADKGGYHLLSSKNLLKPTLEIANVFGLRFLRTALASESIEFYSFENQVFIV